MLTHRENSVLVSDDADDYVKRLLGKIVICLQKLPYFYDGCDTMQDRA